MPIHITLAKLPEQIDAVFKIRHTVFSEEEGKFSPTHDGRMFDRFDAYPTSSNLIVLGDGEVVGSMRLTLDSEMGMPADEYYDFRAHLPPESRALNCGMYCVTKQYRSSRIAYGLMLMASYFAVSNNITHVVAPINPDIAKMLGRVGFKTLDEEFTEAHTGVNIVPVMLEVKHSTDYFINFAYRNQLQNFLGSYDCLFFREGEYVVRAGEHGTSAFVIIEGEVEVRLPGRDEPIDTMGEGEIFGELALLTDEIRTAHVIAKSELRVMMLAKSVFMEYLLHHPEKAIVFMQSIGSRMKNLISKMHA